MALFLETIMIKNVIKQKFKRYKILKPSLICLQILIIYYDFTLQKHSCASKHQSSWSAQQLFLMKQSCSVQVPHSSSYIISEPDHLHRAHWHGNTLLLSALSRAVVSLQPSQYNRRCVYSSPSFFFSIYYVHVSVGVHVYMYILLTSFVTLTLCAIKFVLMHETSQHCLPSLHFKLCL